MDSDDEGGRSPFAPRKSLARTPPQGTGEMAGRERAYSAGAEKRMLTSPEEVGSAPQKPRMDMRMCRPATPYRAGTSGVTVPPIAGIAAATTRDESSEAPIATEKSLAEKSKIELMDKVKDSLSGIMSIVTASHSKLNKSDTNAVSSHVYEVLAVMAALSLRLGDTELNLAEAKLKATIAENRALREATLKRVETQAQRPTYANTLKLAKGGVSMPIPSADGPILAFYPAPEQVTKLKTAEDTKAELKKTIKPTEIKVQVEKVKKVGNAGVVVQTTNKESADKLRNATPPTLRVEEPRKKAPQVSLKNLDGDPDPKEILDALYEQNLKGSEWSLEKITNSCKIIKKRGFRGTNAVLECSAKLRQALMDKGRLYIGWQVVEVCDHISVLCCTKCQQYGHPERFCRAVEVTCGKCGETGHRKTECSSNLSCCATCKRFGKTSEGHATASRECPARQFAEKRLISMTNYGS